MSWDVLMIRTKENNEPINEIASDNIISFKQTEIADAIKKIAPLVSATYDCDNLAWPVMDSSNWSIEFNVGEDEETQAVTLRIMGGEEPTEVLKALKNDLGTRLGDYSTGEFMDFDKPLGFGRWKTYHNKVVNGIK